MKLIDKSVIIVDIIEKRIKELRNLYKEKEGKLDPIQKTAILLCIEECKAILSSLLNIIETNDADAEEYSSNIESRLFSQLTKEQQKLWKEEIEQAYKAGKTAEEGQIKEKY